jgi:hypothetical protein
MHLLVMIANWLLTALATIFLWPAAALPQTASDGTETVRQTLEWPAGATHALELSNISGSVRITGYDGRAVELVAVRTGLDRRGFSPAEALAAVHMDMRTGTSGIVVCADAEHCGCESDTWSDRGRRDRDRPQVEVAFELRVPRDTTLRACTINGKELTVDGLSGGFDVSNVNGALRLTNMSGTGSATTVNGDVTAEFTKNPTGDESFKTVNGDIDVRYPADLSADLRMKTMNGGMFTDFDVTARPTDAAVSPERRNGRFVYRGNSFATVRVGRGGPRLTFEGLNSRIEVLKQK